eukprot:1646489-Rhodomonas_salina.1
MRIVFTSDSSVEDAGFTASWSSQFAMTTPPSFHSLHATTTLNGMTLPEFDANAQDIFKAEVASVLSNY